MSKKKKKIGILTINDYTNYGNRLQNYAVERIVKSFGYQPETILNNTVDIKKKEKNKFLNKLKRIKSMSVQNIYSRLKNKIMNRRYKRIREKLIKDRINNFKFFSNKYLNETDFKISRNDIPDDLNKRYQFFITGSDQVWNPTFLHNSEIDFLRFAPKEKRIAFSPSFGVAKIPKKHKPKFAEWLSGIEFLSVREEAGANIIRDLLNRDAKVLVDPTMLLSKEDWLKISKFFNNKPSKYLLTYILSDLNKEDEKSIKLFAKRNDLEIINLVDINSPRYYSVSPNEFIDLICNASLVLTDSFHASIFSILFQKPFLVFNRKDTSLSQVSRLNTLLNKFDYKDRLANNFTKLDNDVFEIKFSHVDSILTKEREKSIKFLEKSFSGDI